MKNKVFNMDCVKIMKTYENKFFDLAVVDPPYGININTKYNKLNDGKNWDSKIPDAEYFEELFRVSKNQIIWGGNYMTEFLKPSRGWIFWDKQIQIKNFGDGELAWTSFDKVLKKVTIQHNGFQRKDNIRIHPTQKPIMLYEWIFTNYANKTDKILDTHLGSKSSRIAAYKMDLNFTGFEIDKDYFDAQNKRFKNFTNQKTLFNLKPAGV